MDRKYNQVLTAVHWTLLCLLFAHLGLKAQPFDTLLSQYNTISELYPLADSTYFLIGVQDNYRVERIDRKANVLWSVDLPSWKEYSIKEYKINITPNDSSIQLLFTDDGCNVEDVESYGSYTLNAQGVLTDQLSWPAAWGFPFLLSGHSSHPRVGISGNPYCILIDATGDTTQVLLTWEDGDTTNWDLIGPPRRMAMAPNGDLLVGGTFYVFMLHLQSGLFKVYDTSKTFYHQSHLFCVEDSSFIEVREHSLLRWFKGFPENEFQTEAYLAHYDIEWRDPDLTVRIDHYDKPDSIFILNKHLTVKSAVEIPWLYGPEELIITDSILFTIGHGNYYFDYGLLKSENRITHEGPLTYDVKLDDVSISRYDSVHFHGSVLHYTIPELTATITNTCDDTIQHAAIAYAGPYTRHCGDSIWTRSIDNMNLAPGQTKAIKVSDVFVRHFYRSDYPECFYLLRPDNHKDDFPDDNELCLEVELLPINPDPYPIHHRPSIITESITFYSPDLIDFTLNIFTLDGVSVFTGPVNTFSNATVTLNHLLPGMYILQYTILATGKVYTEKIIKPY